MKSILYFISLFAYSLLLYFLSRLSVLYDLKVFTYHDIMIGSVLLSVCGYFLFKKNKSSFIGVLYASPVLGALTYLVYFFKPDYVGSNLFLFFIVSSFVSFIPAVILEYYDKKDYNSVLMLFTKLVCFVALVFILDLFVWSTFHPIIG